MRCGVQGRRQALALARLVCNPCCRHVHRCLCCSSLACPPGCAHLSMSMSFRSNSDSRSWSAAGAGCNSALECCMHGTARRPGSSVAAAERSALRRPNVAACCRHAWNQRPTRRPERRLGGNRTEAERSLGDSNMKVMVSPLSSLFMVMASSLPAHLRILLRLASFMPGAGGWRGRGSVVGRLCSGRCLAARRRKAGGGAAAAVPAPPAHPC